MDPAKVTILIEIEQEKERTFDQVPIEIIGLNDAYKAEFVDPVEQSITLTALGAQRVLNAIQLKDIEVYLNVSELGIGEHDVPIEVNGPQNVRWKLPQKEATIRITRNE